MSIHVDPTRGHITAYSDGGQVVATCIDGGGVLIVDSQTALTPDQAYEYAHAIFKWAATKRRAQRARGSDVEHDVCAHDWMLRPESDTWECLICREER